MYILRNIGTVRRSLSKPAYYSLDTSDPIVNGMAGCWLLGDATAGFARDASIYRNYGVPTNMATSAIAPSHHGGQSLLFDGVDDYVLVPNSISQPFNEASNNQVFSACGWLYPTDFHNFGMFFCRWNETSNLRLFALGIFADAKFYAYHSTNGVNFPNTSTISTLSLNTWYFLCVTSDPFNPVGGATGKKLYINAVLDASGQADGLTTNNTQLYIGRALEFGGVGASYFKGRMEGWRYYNRVLAPAEITRLYVEPYAGLKIADRPVRGVPLFVRGTVRELGTPVAGKTLRLYDGSNGALVDTTTSAGDGTYALAAGTRPNVYAMAFDPTTYQAEVQDQLVPLP